MPDALQTPQIPDIIARKEYAKTNIPAEKAPSRQGPRISGAYEHKAGEEGSLPPPGKGAEALGREKSAVIYILQKYE
jgi:hypothetical protein